MRDGVDLAPPPPGWPAERGRRPAASARLASGYACTSRSPVPSSIAPSRAARIPSLDVRSRCGPGSSVSTRGRERVVGALERAIAAARTPRALTSAVAPNRTAVLSNRSALDLVDRLRSPEPGPRGVSRGSSSSCAMAAARSTKPRRARTCWRARARSCPASPGTLMATCEGKDDRLPRAWPPGVGKTYRMLQEGHAERRRAATSSIGLLETHGRAETARARRRAADCSRAGASTTATSMLEEMDLPAILRPRARAVPDRRARAHERARRRARQALRGRRGRPRRRASTSSRRSTSSTSSRSTTASPSSAACACARRSPTRCSADADEVVLIDLTPEALLDRLRAGKVYPAERIDAALNNFFRIENLAALREIALRQVAEEVEAKRLTTELVGSREDTLAARRAAGGRRAAAGARGALPGRAAARAPCVALGPAPGRRARPAVGPAARHAASTRSRSARCGAAPARLGARARSC